MPILASVSVEPDSAVLAISSARVNGAAAANPPITIPPGPTGASRLPELARVTTRVARMCANGLPSSRAAMMP
ncbi:hypothetical protein GCM10027169_11340 [Gordonia jinhuaensis]